MSKQSIPHIGSPEEDLPPPYTERASEHGSSSHLSSLRTSVNSQNSTHENSHILSLLVDPIDAFITQANSLRPAPKVVEGTFIPAEALSPEWTLTDQGERHKGELTKVIRVETHTKEDRKISKETSSWTNTVGELSKDKEFDDWGRWDEPGASADSKEASWWTDEDLALRLARHIQPTSLRGMSARAEQVTFRRENEMGIWESRSGWGLVVRLEL